MSHIPNRSLIRALVGVALALALAAFAAPAAADSDEAATPAIETASVDFSVGRAVFAPAPPTDLLASVKDAITTRFDEAIYAAVEAARIADAQRAEAAARRAAARNAALAAAPTGSIDEIIARHFGAAAGQARAIAVCESNLNPRAVSHTNDHGLFQINIVHQGQFTSVTGHPWSARYDPEVNTAYAKWLYDQQGWRPWVCRKVL